MIEPSTQLEYRSYGDDEECAAAFQWGFANHIDVRYPSIRVIGAPRFLHDALDLWDQSPGHAGLTLSEFLDKALGHPTPAPVRAAA
jgi:hypothetical protein